MNKLEKTLWGLMILLGCVVVVALLSLIGLEIRKEDSASQTQEEEDDQTPVVSTQDSVFPTNIYLQQVISSLMVQDDSGELIDVLKDQDKKTVILFWASWCPVCQRTMDKIEDFQKIAEDKDIQLLLVDRLDGDRETKASATALLKDNGLSSYFDVHETYYQSWGIQSVPTWLFINEKGILEEVVTEEITDKSVFEAYINNLAEGKEKSTFEFIENNMVDSLGGVHSLYNQEEAEYGEEVLSESQGLLMDYTVESGKKDLFSTSLDYLETYMLKDGLIVWKVENGSRSESNAFVDDLRIYKAVSKANDLWGGYEEILGQVMDSIGNYGLDEEERLVDYYSLTEGAYAKRITLCYLDLKTIKELETKEIFPIGTYDKSLSILEKGRISDDFPLYYSWYSYEEETYDESSLNMAEEMLLLWHLAQADQLPQSSLDWIRKALEGDGIFSRYRVDGSVEEGYDYESTAVYALAAMIGFEMQAEDVESMALDKMDSYRVEDTSSTLNGVYVSENEDINIFDQLLPITAYTYIDNNRND